MLHFQKYLTDYILDITYGWNPTGSGMLMYCTHKNNVYQIDEPVPLSNTEVSVVRMKTLETEYQARVQNSSVF